MANQNKGRFIDIPAAKKEIDDYIDHLRQEGKDPEEMALGHVYGLSKVEELMTFIANYNAAGPAQPIDGIRLYLAWDANCDKPDKTDIVFMPVTEDGNDLYPVFDGKEPDEYDENGTALAEGWPCPVFCDD